MWGNGLGSMGILESNINTYLNKVLLDTIITSEGTEKLLNVEAFP